MRFVVALAVLGGSFAFVRQDGVHPRGHDREGLLIAERPLPAYADDVEHPLNRLHAALFIATLVPDEVGSALPTERRAAGEAFFAPKWYFGKRAGTPDDAAVFGGDVRFSPLRELNGERAIALRALLAAIQTKAQVDAIDALATPIMRLLLQWDLLSMWWRCERDKTADAATLLAMARAIEALAQARTVLAALPTGTDELRSALASKDDSAPSREHAYFPRDLLATPSSFVEIDRNDMALFHAERSLRAVRAFVRVSEGRAAGEAIVRAAAAAGKEGPLPEVPRGSEVALALSLLAVDADLAIVATSVVDEVRVRRITGERTLRADNGSSRDGMSHWVYFRSRRASRDADAAHAFRFVPDTTQAMFLEYGTLKHTVYFAQCALCHRLVGGSNQTPAGITSLGRFAGARVCDDPQTRLRRAEVQARTIGERLRARLKTGL